MAPYGSDALRLHTSRKFGSALHCTCNERGFPEFRTRQFPLAQLGQSFRAQPRLQQAPRWQDHPARLSEYRLGMRILPTEEDSADRWVAQERRTFSTERDPTRFKHVRTMT